MYASFFVWSGWPFVYSLLRPFLVDLLGIKMQRDLFCFLDQVI
jgi:hypothetical protein